MPIHSCTSTSEGKSDRPHQRPWAWFCELALINIDIIRFQIKKHIECLLLLCTGVPAIGRLEQTQPKAAIPWYAMINDDRIECSIELNSFGVGLRVFITSVYPCCAQGDSTGPTAIASARCGSSLPLYVDIHCVQYKPAVSIVSVSLRAAHTGRVTGVKFIPDYEWLVSVSRDKSFQFYCTKTGRKLGSYEAQAWCLAVEYPWKGRGEGRGTVVCVNL